MTDANSDPGDALKHLRSLVEAESGNGLAVLRDPADNPVCSITLDRYVPCIVIRWRRYATSAQMRFIHECLLDQLVRHRVDRILGDDTSLPTIHAEDQRWIAEDWMPRAIAAGLKAAASKRPTSYFGQRSVETVHSASPAGLSLRGFESMDDARRWLANVAGESGRTCSRWR